VTALDDQPVRVEMLSPAGTRHMVLERERAAFEARGWAYASPEGGRVLKAAAAGSEPGPGNEAPTKQRRRTKKQNAEEVLPVEDQEPAGDVM